jgi:RHS repeat-associated protein
MKHHTCFPEQPLDGCLPDSQTVHFSNRNQAQATVDAMGFRTSYAYDLQGQLQSIQDANGDFVTNVYMLTGGSLIDDAGTVTNTFSYWPYGELRTTVIGNLPTPFLYCGRWGYYTDTTGRIYVRARTYRPVFTRWLTVDPLWPWESAYRYGISRPLSVVDASGLSPALEPASPNAIISYFPFCVNDCAGCTKTNDLCKWVRDKGHSVPKEGLTGFVACCYGKVVACVDLDAYPKEFKLTPEERKKFTKCTRVHEEVHVKRFPKKGNCSSWITGKLKRHDCGVLGVRRAEASAEECPAFVAGISCMMKEYPDGCAKPESAACLRFRSECNSIKTHCLSNQIPKNVLDFCRKHCPDIM